MKDFFKNKVSFGFFLFFLLFGLSQIFFGEKTAVRGGFFYDGSVYADITMHFEELVFHKYTILICYFLYETVRQSEATLLTKELPAD